MAIDDKKKTGFQYLKEFMTTPDKSMLIDTSAEKKPSVAVQAQTAPKATPPTLTAPVIRGGSVQPLMVGTDFGYNPEAGSVSAIRPPSAVSGPIGPRLENATMPVARNPVAPPPPIATMTTMRYSGESETPEMKSYARNTPMTRDELVQKYGRDILQEASPAPSFRQVGVAPTRNPMEMTSDAYYRMNERLKAQNAGELFGSAENRARQSQQLGLKQKWEDAREKAILNQLSPSAQKKYLQEQGAKKLQEIQLTPAYQMAQLQSQQQQDEIARQERIRKEDNAMKQSMADQQRQADMARYRMNSLTEMYKTEATKLAPDTDKLNSLQQEINKIATGGLPQPTAQPQKTKQEIASELKTRLIAELGQDGAKAVYNQRLSEALRQAGY